MLTRQVLDECLEKARIELRTAPPDGALAYLADKLQRTITADDNFGVVLAVAYHKAVILEQRN